MTKKYDDGGLRLTDCCAAYSTFDGMRILHCEQCGQRVEEGEGDGQEFRTGMDVVSVAAYYRDLVAPIEMGMVT